MKDPRPRAHRPSSPPAAPRALLLLLLAAAALAVGGPATPASDHPANRPIDAAVRQALRVAPELGVQVIELGSGETVYSYRAAERRIVASNTKVFTTAAALEVLGPDYFFETWLLGRGPVAPAPGGRGGVLRGDLAVVGGGDPNISERHTGDPYHVFKGWAEELARRGISRIEGDLYLVHGFFDDERVHPAWPRDQLAKWYEAPVDALSFNDNCVWVRVAPSAEGQARVDVLPRVDVVDVRNLTRGGGNRRQHRVVVTRPPDSNRLEVRGYVWRDAEPLDAWVTVPDPVAYFGAALVHAWEQEGITVAGRVRQVDRLPAGGWERYDVFRSDLLTTLEVINKRSQNFYAESLIKTLGAERCRRGTWDAGIDTVEEFLEGVGIPRDAYEMDDGSGMSRENRFTAEQMVLLLRHMFFHRWGPEFVRSLPYGGEPGLSWERRLAEPPYRGNVFAKTGTLNGVSTLSGYAKGRSGKVYAFSILANRTDGAWAARRAQDGIVEALVENG